VEGAGTVTIQLRDYQRAAIDAVYDYWSDKRGDHPLIVAPTGAGKSLIIATLVKEACEFPGTRILMLTHVKELLEQNAQELLKFYPQADFGFYSASVGQKRLDKQITFGGIQSIWQRAPDMIPPPDLVLIDEAHMLPPKDTTRYGKFISDLVQCNPAVKIIGLTATPYRMDSGYLHKGKDALFDGIAYDIPVGMLMDQGHLAPVISKGGVKEIDLSNVHKRGGEYIESELAAAASDPELVRAVVEEITTLGQDRRAWLVFASGVNHAEMLRQEFEARGVSADVVTGADSKADREGKIEAFRAGRSRCLINVNVLTTGFNVPHVDLVALVRATMSTGLYVQMVGRGTRTAEGKENCLVLDYGNNVAEHGFIDAVSPKIKGTGEGTGDAPVKKCPECEFMCPISVPVCPYCGHQFPPRQLNHGTTSYGGAMLSSQVQAEWLDVEDVTYQLWKKEGKPDSIRVTYHCGVMRRVSEWLCPDHGGYAAERYKARKTALTSYADTTADAMLECEAWTKPSRIKVKPDPQNPKFDTIVQLDYTQRKPDETASQFAGAFDDDIPF
jgi:DNA repair protein RadD